MDLVGCFLLISSNLFYYSLCFLKTGSYSKDLIRFRLCLCVGDGSSWASLCTIASHRDAYNVCYLLSENLRLISGFRWCGPGPSIIKILTNFSPNDMSVL